MGNNHCNADSNTVKWAESFFIVRFMDQEYPLARKLNLSLEVSRRICLTLAALACLLPSLARGGGYGPNILPAGSFSDVQSTYVPWAGVDDKGNIHGIEGRQLAVMDDGSIPQGGIPFGPSVAVADLNGDGKPDLVMADSKGYFWYYPNTGTATSPAFTQGDVMPIWLGEERLEWDTESVDNIVPRIQLVDFDGNKRLDILAGIYSGKLFRIRNIGSSTQPVFKPTTNRENLLINTHKKGALWCNYLAPCMTTLFGSPNVLDLIMGEGTYSANSIYLLRNTNSSANPSFDENHLQKIIPGMGLEQLTPAVVDWNNDGKPDVICGDRTGYLNLYLNTSADADHLTFATGTHITIGGQEKLGGALTVTVCDLTGNHLPNLLIGKDDGTILYATNTGKLGAPAFATPPTPIKGVLPPNYHYVSPTAWNKLQAWGVPYELLACVNPQLEPGFTFPEGETTKYALKFSVWPYKSTYFPERYYPPVEDFLREHLVTTPQRFTIKLNTRYRVHFWIKGDGNLSDLRFRLSADHPDRIGYQASDVTTPVSASSSWSEVSSEFEMRNSDDPTVTTWGYGFEFRFTGQPTFYVDDLQIQEVVD